MLLFYSAMLGRGYLSKRDEGKDHFFTFGVELGDGELFFLKVNSRGGVAPILRLL